MKISTDFYGLLKGDVEDLCPLLKPHISVQAIARRSDYYGDYYSFDLENNEVLTIAPNHYWENEDGSREYVQTGFEEYEILIKVTDTPRPEYWQNLLTQVFPDLVFLERFEDEA